MDEENLLEKEDEGQPIPSGDEDFLDQISLAEIDASQFSSELLVDAAKEYTPDQEQNLYQKILKMTVPQKIHLAILGNTVSRNILVRDPNKLISLAVIRNPRITETEALNYAQQKNLHEDVLQAISRHKNWIKNYMIKLALASNPKTPLPVAIKILDHIHDKDLQVLSRNKNISSVVCRSAARLLIKRKG
jgi:hypothetical protein